MRKILIFFLVVLFSIMGCSQSVKEENKKLTTKTDSVSYSIGIDIGNNFKKQEIEIEPHVLLQGIQDAFADTSILSKAQMLQVLRTFQTEMTAKRQQKQKEMAEKNKVVGEKNKAEAEAFFAKNKTKKGVITLPSGIQYKVLKSGSGPSPKLSDKVEVNYIGRLLDGTEFDNSYKRGKPLENPVTRFIKGWTEILQKMKVGDKWEVFIPSDLAYGARGSGPIIGPNAALDFTIELLSIKK